MLTTAVEPIYCDSPVHLMDIQLMLLYCLAMAPCVFFSCARASLWYFNAKHNLHNFNA